jgi:arylsulfatase A-like enzyme
LRSRVGVRLLPVLALACLVAAGCGWLAERPRNLVLISIDTLRPDFLGAYGHARATSPALDALARSGVLFETAQSTAPWTLPAHGSLLTGLYPSRHGVIGELGLPYEVATLAEILAAAGFQTAAIVNSHHLSPRYGLDRGFASFRYAVEFPTPAEPSVVGDWAREWIGEAPREPFFLFLHFYDVHSDYRSLPEVEARFVAPYAGPVDGSTRQLMLYREGRFPLDAADRRHLVQLYEAGVRQMDDGIARLLADLERAGLREQSLLVVTSDHGEEFLEHGDVLHGRTQYEEMLRVPLLFNGPGLPAGRRVVEPVSLVDVVPTVLAQLGVPAPSELDGRDLAPLWRGEAPPQLRDRTLLGEADHSGEAPNLTASARHGRFKLVLDRASGEARLFDLQADPAESRDTSSQHPEQVARLRAEIERLLAEPPLGRPLELEPLHLAEVERLEALGYLQRHPSAAEPDEQASAGERSRVNASPKGAQQSQR